jgi:hypothetical protein
VKVWLERQHSERRVSGSDLTRGQPNFVAGDFAVGYSRDSGAAVDLGGEARSVVALGASGTIPMRTNRTQLALICIPVVLALAAIITAVALYITSPRRPMASQADCDRLQVGMTRAEVEQILGGPPGDYRTRDSITPYLQLQDGSWDEWQGDGGMILVEFDEGGRVRSKEHFDHWVIRQRSLIDRIMSR